MLTIKLKRKKKCSRSPEKEGRTFLVPCNSQFKHHLTDTWQFQAALLYFFYLFLLYHLQRKMQELYVPSANADQSQLPLKTTVWSDWQGGSGIFTPIFLFVGTHVSPQMGPQQPPGISCRKKKNQNWKKYIEGFRNARKIFVCDDIVGIGWRFHAEARYLL